VHAVVPLPDGRRVISAGEDGQLVVFDLANGSVALLPGHEGPVNHAVLTPDGRAIVSGGDDGTVQIRDVDALEEPRVLGSHDGYVRQVAASGPRVLSGAQDGLACLWDREGHLLHTFDHRPHDVMSVAISPDGGLGVVGTINSALHLWDLESGEQLAKLYGTDREVMTVPGFEGLYLGGTNDSGVGHGSCPTALLFSDDERYLISAADEIIVWDLAAGVEHARSLRLGWPVKAMRMLDDEVALVAANGIHLHRIRDRASGAWLAEGATEWLGSLAVDESWPEAVAIARDGHLIIGHESGAVSVRPLAFPANGPLPAGHTGAVTEIVCTARGDRAASMGDDGSIRLWDLRSASRLAAIDTLLEANGRALAFVREGRVLLVPDGEVLAACDATTGAALPSLAGPPIDGYDRISDLAGVRGRDEALVCRTQRAGVALWDLSGAGAHRPVEGFARQPSEPVFLGDGRLATIHTYYAEEEKARAEELERDPTLATDDESYRFYPNAQLHLTGIDALEARLLWSIAAVTPPGERHALGFGRVQPLPDGATFLAGAGDSTTAIAIRDGRSGELLRRLEVGFPYLEAFAVDDGGSWVIGGADRVAIVDPRTWAISLRVLEDAAVRAFARRGRLAIATSGSRLAIHDAGDGKLHDRCDLHATIRVVRVAQAEDGRERVIVGDARGHVRIFAIED
jgi:WD40 repeat protein